MTTFIAGGSIQEGKWADTIVLDQNLLEIPVTEIHKVRARKAVFNGEVVFEAE